MPNNKKRKVPPNQIKAYAKFFIPPPQPESELMNPQADNGCWNLVQRYINRHGSDRIDSQVYLDMHNRLYVQHAKAITARFEAEHGPISRMDTIDLTDSGLTDDSTTVKNTIGRIETLFDQVPNPILAYTPCYNKGLLRATETIAFYFEILNLDLEKQQLELFLTAIRYLDASSSVVEPGTSGRITITTTKNKDGRINIATYIHPGTTKFFTDLYSELTPKELGWTPLEADYWQKVIIQNAANQQQRFRTKGLEPIINVSNQFLTWVTTVNSVLESNKLKLLPKQPGDEPTAVPKPKQDNLTKPDQPKQTAPYDSDKPRIRVVRGIKFTSRRPPRRAAQTARQYKTPAWTVRGHTRTYKSGKTVYIQPTVRKRKNLADSPPQQSILKIQ